MARPPLPLTTRARMAALAGAPARAALRFLGNRRGSTSIEFAFVLIPFLALFLGLMQVGIFYFASESLESAVEAAARSLYTGTAQTAGISSASAFRTTYMCPQTGPTMLPAIIDCSKLIIDVRSASSFSSANLSTDFYKSTPMFCPGAPGDIIIVRVIYPLPAIIPVLSGSPGSPSVLRAGMVNDVPGNAGWKQLVLGTAVFQNEPYDGTKYVAPSGC